MKKITILMIGALIYTFFFESCKKDEETKNESPSFFVINNEISENIYHKIYEPPLLIDKNYQNDSINLDNDNKYDIRFDSYSLYSNDEYEESTQYRILNDSLKISCKFYPDSAYICSYMSNDTMYNWFFHYPVTCNDNSELIVYDDWGGNNPVKLELGDTLYFIDTNEFIWLSDEFGLSYKDSIAVYQLDESIYEFTNRFHGIWNNSGIKYMAFKIEENEIIKYGWIKLEIFKNENIKIYEFVCFIRE